MEQFWFYMHQELTESAQVVSYNGEVALPNGDTVSQAGNPDRRLQLGFRRPVSELYRRHRPSAGAAASA